MHGFLTPVPRGSVGDPDPEHTENLTGWAEGTRLTFTLSGS